MKTLFEKLSETNKANILITEKKYPATVEYAMKSLNANYFKDDLTIQEATNILIAIDHRDCLDLNQIRKIFI